MRRAFLLALGLWLAGCRKDPPVNDPALEAEGQYLAGTSAFMRGDYAAAHQAFERVKALRPEDPRLPAAYGELLFSENRLAEARTSFEEAVRRDPQRATSWSRLGTLQALTGQRAEARRSLEKALALNPTEYNAADALAELWLTEGDAQKAAGLWRRAAKAAPEALQPALVARAANTLAQLDQPALAVALLEEAAATGIDDPALAGLEGEQWLKLGDREKASEAYRRAALKSKGDPFYWRAVGEIAEKLGQLPQAEEAYRASIREKPEAGAHIGLARLCLRRKERGCAQEALDHALALATGDAQESRELARLLAKTGHAPAALRLLKEAAADPELSGNAAAQLELAQLARRLEDLPTVKEACARAHDAGVARCP